MTPAFQKLFLALFVCISLQLLLSAPVEAAHGDSHVRRSLTHKNRVVVDRSLKNVARDDFLDSVASECSSSLIVLYPPSRCSGHGWDGGMVYE